MCLHASTRADPAHTAVRANNPKFCLVISAILDAVMRWLPDFGAIVRVRTGNELFKCDPSKGRKTQLSTARARNPDFIFLQIPLPHSEIGGICGQVESLLANFQ